MSSTVRANKVDVSVLEKVYRLDAVKSSGLCPSVLKKVFLATKKDFGYRSKELV